jgi:hypothetical protein
MKLWVKIKNDLSFFYSLNIYGAKKINCGGRAIIELSCLKPVLILGFQVLLSFLRNFANNKASSLSRGSSVCLLLVLLIYLLYEF